MNWCTHISPWLSLHSTSLHLRTLHILTTIYFTSLHLRTLHILTTIYFTSLHFTTLHFTSLHLLTLHILTTDALLKKRTVEGVLSSGIKIRVARCKLTDDSEEHIASIFRVEYAEQDTSVKEGSKPESLLVGWLSTDYTALYPRIQYSS
jgi:hypothetical protein